LGALRAVERTPALQNVTVQRLEDHCGESSSTG
jgi:hypothetical protein